jgi:hypothetical protein
MLKRGKKIAAAKTGIKIGRGNKASQEFKVYIVA